LNGLNKEFFMNLALSEAWRYQFLTYPNPAVGALLLDRNGKILAISSHKKAGLPHAEVEVFKQGYIELTGDTSILKLDSSHDLHHFLSKNHNDIFKGCTLFVTLEPCNSYGKTPPCTNLIKILFPKKVFIGSRDISNGGGKELERVGIEVEYGVCLKGCDDLLEPFLKWSKGRFILFKSAQRLNGTIDGGYISDKESLTLVHKIRDRLDLLVIGGNTARIDTPTLDARFCNGKAPDIFILSKGVEFGREIPLFGVEGRGVTIGNSLDFTPSQRFVMVEGGSTMLETCKEMVDWEMHILSPRRGGSLHLDGNWEGEYLHSYRLNNDLIIFSRRRCAN